MAQRRPFNEVSWRPGTLRRYESMASLGAKYCFLNRVRPSRFGKLLEEYLPTGVHSRLCTVDVPGFRLNQFAKLLDEPIQILRSQSALVLELPSMLQDALGSYGMEFGKLRACPCCLTEGYHSVLHQLPWLERCLIHDVQLVYPDVHYRSIQKGFPADTAYIHALWSLWFGENSCWPGATERQWAINQRADENRRIKALIQSCQQLDADIAHARETGKPLPVMDYDIPCGDRLLMLAEFFGHSSRDWGHYVSSNPKHVPRVVVIPCSKDMANFVLTRRWGWLNCLQDLRRLECEIKGGFPQWRLNHKALLGHLLQGHKKCVVRNKELSAKWIYHQPRLPFEYDKPDKYFAHWLSRHNVVPCKRLLLIESLHLANDLDEIVSDIFESIYCHDGSDNLRLLVNKFFLTDLNMPQLDPPIFHLIQGSIPPFVRRMDGRPYPVDSIKSIGMAPPLAKLVDELLLMWVWSTTWELHSLEQLQNVNHNGLLRYCRHFVIEPYTEGLRLRFMQDVPMRFPTWNAKGTVLRGHCDAAMQMFDRIDSRLEQILNKWLDELFDTVNKQQTPRS